MARLNDLAHGRLDAPKLAPYDIIIKPGWNYRDADSEAVQRHIAWLKDSIKERGVQKPIEVEFVDGQPVLVDGECRVKAARLLWDEGVEVYLPAIQAKGDEAEIRAKSMVANGALPPTLLEFGRAAAQLRAYGWSDERIAAYTPPHIAKDTAKAKRYVRDAVELQEAPIAVKEAVTHGFEGVTVSPALALAATRKNRILASEIIKEEVVKAKSAGKKVASRPKGAGKATKAKAAAADSNEALLKIGDRMAKAFLSENPDWDVLERLATNWQKARG